MDNDKFEKTMGDMAHDLKGLRATVSNLSGIIGRIEDKQITITAYFKVILWALPIFGLLVGAIYRDNINTLNKHDSEISALQTQLQTQNLTLSDELAIAKADIAMLKELHKNDIKTN